MKTVISCKINKVQRVKTMQRCVGMFFLVQIEPTSFLTMGVKPSTSGLLSCCSFSTVSVRADELKPTMTNVQVSFECDASKNFSEF